MPVGLIGPPISLLATENLPKVKLGQVEVGLDIAKKKSYLINIIPNS